MVFWSSRQEETCNYCRADAMEEEIYARSKQEESDAVCSWPAMLAYRRHASSMSLQSRDNKALLDITCESNKLLERPQHQ